MMFEIENAVVVGRSFGDNLVYSVLDEATGKTIQMLGNPEMEILELGTEGMVCYTSGNSVNMLSFHSMLVEELV